MPKDSLHGWRKMAANIRRRRSSRSALRQDLWRGWRCCSIWGSAICRLERSTPTLSPGELQRLRLATQVRSNLFGVVYVLDEPSAGLHPADTEALLTALDQLKASGNSLFVVEHDLDVIRHADWIVDVGPAQATTVGSCSTAGRRPGSSTLKHPRPGAICSEASAPRRARRARRRAG